MGFIEILVFAILVIAALAADLVFVGGKGVAPSMKTAGIWTGSFISIAIAYGIFLHIDAGAQIATEYFTAYAIEKVLSVDNLFVFILVFGFFKVPAAYEHKVLFYGIIGAFILRGIFIFAGATFIDWTYFDAFGYHINGVLTIFGLILIWKGYGAFRESIGSGDDEDEDFNNTFGAKVVRWLTGGKVLTEYDGDKFFTTRYFDDKARSIYKGVNTDVSKFKAVKYGTLLLVVVGVVEFTDVLFAVDSIPAIFSVTQNKMVLYTSNIFAILGLRSMYFLLKGMKDKFHLLGYGLAFILAFIGAKMVVAPWFHIEGITSLIIVLGVLALSIGLSFIIPNKEENVEQEQI